MPKTATPTWDSLIARWAESIAYIAADDSAPADTTNLTPRAFASLVRDAVDHLTNIPLTDYQNAAEELDVAAIYLADALHAEPAELHVLLSKAAKRLPIAYDMAQELRNS